MNTEGIVARPYQRWRRLFALNWRTTLFCYVALLPILALFAYVRVIPIGFSVVLSFYKWKLISPLKPFIGLDNYTQLMSDDNFILALKNTTIYSLSTVLISIVLALPLAVFLAGGRRLSAFYQTVYFLPVITPHGADGDRLEVDIRLQLRHPQLWPVAGGHRLRALAD